VRRRPLAALAAAAGFVLWVLVAHRLWHSTVPGGLALPAQSERAEFGAAFLARSHSFGELVNILGLAQLVVLLAVLTGYAAYGARFMRESAAGPIGTGMLLGMLGLGIVWLAELPFDVAVLWWERRHDLARQGYVDFIVEDFLGLGGTFLFVSLALTIAMALARRLTRSWWIAAAPIFVGLALLQAFVGPYLLPDVHRLRNPSLAADARRLARLEGVAGTRVDVQRAHRLTSAPNAEAVGFGATRRVILWDTLLDGRFKRREINVVIAHELGHIARDHILKSVGWLALFLVPASLLVAVLTRRRGGLGRPEAVPLALLVLVAAQVATLPLRNVVTRHLETEADWRALVTTRDPTAARDAFQRLAITTVSDPSPPTWSYVLFADHPTIVQRIAMVQAWERRESR
jgi:STE24 endopeptidase